MKKNFFFALFFLCICYSNTIKASIAEDNDSTLTVAAGDTTLKTAYIQAAINYVNSSGGGKVILTPGVYRTASIAMKSNVNLYLDSGATLLGSPIMADWGSAAALITGSGSSSKPLTNIAFSGRGTIDGSGAPWWAAYNANNSISRPRIINVAYINNLTIDSIHVRNSPSMNIFFSYCNNVIIDNVNVYDTSTSPNTDGIDPADSKNILITNCTIDDGDDNIAIKAGRNGSSLVAGGCQDITVANCTFLHGHGLSIGSETNSGYRNLRVVGCTFNGTTNGIRVKSAITAGGLCENLYYSDIKMTGVTNPIVIDMAYNTTGCCASDTPSVKGLYITNFTSTGSSNCGTIAGITGGITNGLVNNIVFNNVSIAPKSGGNGTLTISNAVGVTLTNCIINKVAAKSGTNVILTNVTNTSGF